MSVNLVELIKSAFTNDVLSHAAVQLNESEAHIGHAFQAAVPAILVAAISKINAARQSGLKNSGLQNMVSVAEEAGGDTDTFLPLTDDPNGIAFMEKVSGMLWNLFGERLHHVAEAIADFSGVKPSSAHRLLGAAVPATFVVIGRQAADEKGMEDLIIAQKDTIVQGVPSGFALAGALGWSGLSDMDMQPRVPQYTAEVNPLTRPSGRRWALVALLLVVLIILWYFWKQRNERREAGGMTNTATVIPAADRAGLCCIQSSLIP